MRNSVHWLLEEEDGQGMVEYALIFALVVIGVIGMVQILGENIFTLYEKTLLKMPT